MVKNNSSETLIKLFNVIDELNSIKDIDILLDRILYEARKFTNADAGTIYLLKNGRLTFNYVQNDTLFKKKDFQKYIYTSNSIKVDKKSIAGFVAYTHKSIIIDDAYKISNNLPVSFNTAFDKKTGYRTRSILAVPLKTKNKKVLGVIQIINKLDKNGKVIEFTKEDELYISLFSQSAAIAIERAQFTRENILKMIKIVEMRDPEETGNHVKRVSTYSVEIYEKWAEIHNIDKEQIKKEKDNLRIASMLHDIGKIGIPDSILKKKGKLTSSEFNLIKMHTVYGARLFVEQNSALDKVVYDICLNHHEKWDGTGYPGNIDINSDKIEFKEGKKGTEIPLFARIVSIADVYDALISDRYYKKAWEEKDALDYIKKEKGKHFDPEIVDIFFSIYDTIKAIKNKFKTK